MENLTTIQRLTLLAVELCGHCHEFDIVGKVRKKEHGTPKEDIFAALDWLSVQGLLRYFEMPNEERRHYQLTTEGKRVLMAAEYLRMSQAEF